MISERRRKGVEYLREDLNSKTRVNKELLQYFTTQLAILGVHSLERRRVSEEKRRKKEGH